MNKQEILKVISDERSAHEAWANQGAIIADAINLDSLIEPLNYDESQLYTWLKNNKSSISAFDWYKKLEQVHVQAHYSYSDLFENATRKYNPKTRDELLEEFKIVQADLEEFNNKLNQIEATITDMSDSVYLDFVLKSNAVTRKSEENLAKQENSFESTKQDIEQKENVEVSSENEVAKESNLSSTNVVEFDGHTEEKLNTLNEKDSDKEPEEKMSTIDIGEYEETDNQETQDKIEAQTIVEEAKIDVNTIGEEDKLSEFENAIDSAQLASEYQLLKTGLDSKDTIERHITLKEQNISRLIKEKELSEQELSHLEETQKLSQQGLDQTEQHLKLKLEENELEQLDSEKLLESNTIERDKAKEKLEGFEQEKETLKNQIIDLEQENIKDELIQEENKKAPSVENQFDSLKSNKVTELEELQNELSTKNSDLMQLKQQLLALEDDVADIEDEIEMKQQGIIDLEDKEKSKNDQRSLKIEATEKIIKQRNETINSNNEKLDALTSESDETQKELDDLNVKFEKMKKTIFSMADINTAEIDDIEAQQVSKQKKHTEIYNQKKSKQEEIERIESRLADAEKSLKQLKSEIEENDEKELETSS